MAAPARPGRFPAREGAARAAVVGHLQLDLIWFKGGSEPGVLTLGYLASNSKGQTFVVVAMISDPAAALAPSAEAGLQAIVQGAFHLAR